MKALNISILFISFYLSISLGYSQETSESAENQVERIYELIAKSQNHIEVKNYESASKEALEAYHLASSLHLENETSISCLLTAKVYKLQKNNDEALEYALRSVFTSQNISRENKLSGLIILIQSYSDWGAWDKVIEYARQAEQINSSGDGEISQMLKAELLRAYQETGNSQQAIWTLEGLIPSAHPGDKRRFFNEMIRIKKQKGASSEALKDCVRLQDMLEINGTVEERAACANNMGSIYLDLKEYEFAIVNCENALSYKNDDSKLTAEILINLASAQFKMGRQSQALSHIERSEIILTKLQSEKEASIAIALKARILSSLGDLDGALKAANLALYHAQLTDDLLLQSTVYSLLSSLTKKAGDTLISSEFHSKSSILLIEAEKNKKEKQADYTEKILSLNNKEQILLNSIKSAEEEYKQLQSKLEESNRLSALNQLQYEKELREAALKNEQTARESAIKELELVKAALMAEQQIRVISDLETERTAQKLKVNELNFAQQEKEKGLQILKQENELMASEKRVKEIEMEKEASAKKLRNMIIAFLVFISILTTLGFISSKKKNQYIRLSNERVKEVNEKLKGQNEEIISSIHYARNFQESIIPAEETFKSYLKDSFLIYKPLDIVSGDIPFILKRKNDLYVGAIDCIGHGVPAAMLSFMAYYNLSELIQENENISCGKLLSKLHVRLSESLQKKFSSPNFSAGIDIGLCRIQTETMSIQFAGANLPILIVNKDHSEKIRGDFQSIGDINRSNLIEFKTHERKLLPTDRIFLFSDGIIHQFGGDEGKKKFSSKRLMELLQSLHNTPMNIVKQQLVETFQNWKGITSQTDDIVLIGLELNNHNHD